MRNQKYISSKFPTITSSTIKMNTTDTTKEVEDIISLLFPNHFLKRDLKKLEAIYVAGIAKGIETARQTIEKCGNKTASK